jgi:hypothetical protein
MLDDHSASGSKRMGSAFSSATATDRDQFKHPANGQPTRKFDDAAKTLKGFSVGKPVVVEETFPLKCSPKELDEFIGQARKDAVGWISFYWGKPPEKLRRSKEIGGAILLQCLERFEKRGKILAR